MSITRCGQEVLDRSACEISRDGSVVLRFHVGFPAFGRTINADVLDEILFGLLPRSVEDCLEYANIDAGRAREAVELAEDQEALRACVREAGCVAFVADGSVLPRESGVSDRPMKGAVAFESPATLRRSFCLPHCGEVRGMAVPRGVTLIVGGGYHGKSTLLQALQAGVYDHIAGDGREFVVADDTAVKLRAEDGRSIRNVDISAFIGDLPNGKGTSSFSTPNASGSTSQAAAVVEGLEAKARLFLVDEDTSAANFMVRDELMQRVVARDKEPITPFVDRVRDLYEQEGVSTVIVAGSSGAFFAVADLVIHMDAYRAFDITDRVRAVCAEAGASAALPPTKPFNAPVGTRTLPSHPDVRDDARSERRGRGGRDTRGGRNARGGRADRSERRGGRGLKVRAHGRDTISLGHEDIDVRYLEQIVDGEQTAALGQLMRYGFERLANGGRTVAEAVDETFSLLDSEGWEPFCGSYVPCGLARPRPQELFAAFNRFRG